MNTTKTPILGTKLIPIEDLFSDFVLGKEVIVPGVGSHTEHPKGYLFVAGLRGPGITQSVNFINKKTYFLYGKPTQLFIDSAVPGCVNGHLQSAEIIPWTDRALVLGIDKEMIAHVWVAFISLNDVEKIKVSYNINKEK